MDLDPRVASARICSIDELSSIGVEADIIQFLCVLEPRAELFCLVAIERGTTHYSLVVDHDWTELAIEVAASGDDAIAGMSLPRRAVRAVIDGWIDDWTAPIPGPLVTDLAEDGVPHLHPV